MATRIRRERLDRGIKARCEDIYALLSLRETSYLLLPRALPVIILLILPLLQNVIGLYWEKVLVFTCMYALLALSWDLLASVGLISLGQSLFFGIGAYLAGVFNSGFGWSPALTIPLATISGALLCSLLLLPVLRLRGIYFAVVTLALPLLLSRVIETTRIMGGTEGLGSLSGLPNIWVERYVPVLVLLACLFGFRRLITEDFGVVLRGIKDNDRTVLASGINLYWFKFQAVFLAGLSGTFAGAFMTHYYQFVGMSAFALDYSILPVACVILGGPGTFAGATVGAFILVPLAETLRAIARLRSVFYALVIIICVVALPEGIFHYIQRRYHQFERIVQV